MSGKVVVGSGAKGAKAVDENNLKILRELSQLNRNCFECGQRGPTYVDVTIGSFICMTCSGLLRGLTPPHRVKSISMATFSKEEITLLKERGNEYCGKVWLATYTARDSSLGAEQNPDRRAALKALMSAKYEQKRYYLDPSKIPQLAEIQAQTAQALLQHSSTSKSPSLSSTSSGSSLTHQSVPSPVMNNLRSNRLISSQTLPDLKPLSTLIAPSSINFINNLSPRPNLHAEDKIINTNPHPPKEDPWASELQGVGGVADNFANFDEAFSAGNGNSTNTNGTSTKFDGSSEFANFESMKPLEPFHEGLPVPVGLKNKANTIGCGNGDRYAALKDLDELFKNGNETTNDNARTTASGLPNSTSVPVNLHLSAGMGAGTGGWFVANQSNPNPFAMVDGGTSGFPSNPFSTSPMNASSNQSSMGVSQFNPFAVPAAGLPSSNPHNPFCF